MTIKPILALFALALASTAVHATATPDEVKKLGAELTLFGAEQAGNADGSIPAYTGERVQPPAGFKPGSGQWPDPYPDDKPLYSITAQNVAQYSDKLADWQKELFKRYPATYRMDIYPTRRSATYPKEVLDNTVANATRASLSKDGVAVEGAFGGLPFPIVKNGHQAMWNYLLRYRGLRSIQSSKTFLVDSSGRVSLAADYVTDHEFPYYNNKLGAEKFAKSGQPYYQILNDFAAPSRLIGEMSMQKYWLDPLDKPDTAWSYVPGQRRVRLAPDLSYDTPNPGFSGMITMDDNGVLFGALDRFDYKLVGKKEMYLPYNAYKAIQGENASKITTPHHANPDYKRWELHRVWVVESTLKPQFRHVYSKRVYYFDEDWSAAAMTDAYDNSGKLYRTVMSAAVPLYDVDVAGVTLGMDGYDFATGAYFAGTILSKKGVVVFDDVLPSGHFTPENIQSIGVR